MNRISNVVGCIHVHWWQSGLQYILLSSVGYRSASDLGLDQSTRADQQALDEMIRDHMQLIHDYGGVYQLYRLRN